MLPDYQQQLTSPQIKQIISKKPFSQDINGVEYVYSVLKKKQKTFVMTNDRFVYIRGNQQIAYARELNSKTILPFRQEYQVPKPKFKYLLSDIKRYKNEQSIFIIQFADNQRWEFLCPTKVCAIEWKRRLEIAQNNFNADQQKRYEKYEDIAANKPKISQTNVLNTHTLIAQSNYKPIDQNNQYQTTNQNKNGELLRNQTADYLLKDHLHSQNSLMKSKSEINTFNQSNIVTVKVPDNTQNQIINLGKETNQNILNMQKSSADHPTNQGQETPIKIFPVQIKKQSKQQQIKPSFDYKDINQQKSPINNSPNFSPTLNKFLLAPTTHENKPMQLNHTQSINENQLSKIQQLFLQKYPSQHNLLDKSIISISNDGKQRIRSQIMNSKRAWLDQLISTEEESQLIIDFKRYSQKIIEILVSQLYITNDKKLFPHKQWNKQYASYIIDDVYAEIYFFSEEQIQQKHKKYKQAVRQFKNMDYLLEVTSNQGDIFVPLMVMFQYKGFVGMVKTIINQEKSPYKNQEFFKNLSRDDFQIDSRVNSQIFLDQNKCKIIEFKKNNFLSKLVTEYQPLYFVQNLTQFLPSQKNQKVKTDNFLLRPQFIQDENLEQNVFGLGNKDISSYQIQGIIDKKIDCFVNSIQNQSQYFTNSLELTQLVHSFGLNMRHLGKIYLKTQQIWLKNIIRAEMAARALKNLFRFDMQNCILNQTDRLTNREKQSDRQSKRVTSFLNVVFGNTESTFRVWRGLNNHCNKYFGTNIWQKHFNDININFFLQAIQSHLKIKLNDSIHRKEYFKSMKSLQESDFQKFQFDITIYNLDFTHAFEVINDSLENINRESFLTICQIITKQTHNKRPYFQLLKELPIYSKINEFLLNFVSPSQNTQLYSKIQTYFLPNRFLYETKLAQVKWYLKDNKPQSISKAVAFIEQFGRKWLGQIHPIFVRLYRILAEYYYQHSEYYTKAMDYGLRSLNLQKNIYGSDAKQLWKDYFLLGNIQFKNDYYKQALPLLTTAKTLTNKQAFKDIQFIFEVYMNLSNCCISLRMFKQAYQNVRQLYNKLKEQESSFYLQNIISAVSLIRNLLERNQELEAFCRFIELDFSNIMIYFIDDFDLLKQALKIAFIPYFKNVIFQKSKNRSKIIGLIDQISKVNQSTYSSHSYIQFKLQERKFPQLFIQNLKNIDNVMDEIYSNDMLQRWISFNKMSNQTLLQKIGNNQINRGFQFLADITAIIGLLGNQGIDQLIIMEK